eukprot:scaffold281565_cov21-Tisochrysis_lutea.AAC.2
MSLNESFNLPSTTIAFLPIAEMLKKRRIELLDFYTQAHWMACVFYFIARAQGFTSDTWAGAVETMVDADPWG